MDLIAIVGRDHPLAWRDSLELAEQTEHVRGFMSVVRAFARRYAGESA